MKDDSKSKGESWDRTSCAPALFDFLELYLSERLVKKICPANFSEMPSVSAAPSISDAPSISAAPSISVSPTESCINSPSEGSLGLPIDSTAVVSNTITVSESGTVADIDVTVDISHSWIGDLQVTLSHGGASVMIIDRPGVPSISNFGCSQDDLLVTLDDEATAGAIEDQCPAPGPVTGVFTPNNSLSAFDGFEASGDWTLSIDDRQGGDEGFLNEWSLAISVGGSGCPVAPPQAADAGGNGATGPTKEEDEAKRAANGL